MNTDYDHLIDDILNNYHEKIHETVPFSELGRFLTDFLMKYKELHPPKTPSLTKVGNWEVYAPGDEDLYS